jgi:hypothetical protein
MACLPMPCQPMPCLPLVRLPMPCLPTPCHPAHAVILQNCFRALLPGLPFSPMLHQGISQHSGHTNADTSHESTNRPI